MNNALLDAENKLNTTLCNKIIASTTEQQRNPVFVYDQCELAYDMLGFLENYADIAENLQPDFTIIDLGCNHAMQAAFFKNHTYIGVEPNIPIQNRLKTPNSIYIDATISQFIENWLPDLMDDGLDLRKVFVIASAVPAFDETDLIPDIFFYYRISYPGQPTKSKYPRGFMPYTIYPEIIQSYMVAKEERNVSYDTLSPDRTGKSRRNSSEWIEA